MDALAGATLVADPEPYVGRLAAASPCADTANDAASTSGGSRGVPLFASARVPPSNDAATTIEVVEDLAVFAGGAVWCLDWAPARAGAETTRHVAVEARAKDDVAHALGAVGRARGPGLVQVMALRMPSSSAPDPGAARAAKGKRPRDVPFREKADCATARVVLGLAHDAKHAFDLKWRPSPPTVFDGAVAADDSRVGSLAAALGNGRVEVWRVPTPETVVASVASEKTKTHSSGVGSNPGGDVPVVKCVPSFVGVAPADAGVPLCVDWAVASPRNRIVAGTSAGAVVLWTLPSSDDVFFSQNEDEEEEEEREDGSARPTLPVMRIASTGCPQRSVRFAPLGFSVSKESVSKENDSSFLVIAGGHGMHAPAVFDTRDPFSTCAGSRVSSFGGHNATTRVAMAPNGVLLSSRDDGDVDAHDFFYDARMRRPPRDNAERVARRALAHDAAFSENAIRTFAYTENDARFCGDSVVSRRGVHAASRKQNKASTSGNERRAPSTFAIEPSLALDRGAAWSVDVKPAFGFDSNVATEDVGCVLVLAGFGRAGARLAFLNLGNGLRKVNASRGKDELRDAGEPVDFAFVGATATFSLAPDAEKASRDGKDRHEEGAEDFANVSLDLAGSAAKEKNQSVGVAALTRRADETARERADAVRVGAPAHRGAGGFGFVAEDSFGAVPFDGSLTPQYAPVRCVRWLDPETPVSASPDRAWCAWGDDAGFVRFQRLRGDAVAATARAVSAMETRN